MKFLLVLNHVLPIWLLTASSFSDGTDIMWPKVPITNHSVRLSSGQSPQAKTHLSHTEFLGLKVHFLVAKRMANPLLG